MIKLSGWALGVMGLVAVWHSHGEPGPMPREIVDVNAYPAPLGYVCYPAQGAITLDGKLDEATWKALPWSEDFRDIEGDRKPKPRHRTRMKMAWNKEGLYIAAELDEPHVWGTLKTHDAVIFQDNDFEVFLDPDGDGHLYGELELNALNTTWDLLLSKPYKNGGHAVNAWEITGLKTAVHVDGTLNNAADVDRGWTIEIWWPWAGLRELVGLSTALPPKDGDQWRINFSRVEWDHTIEAGKYVKVPKRPEHNWVWSPQGIIDMHRPERWGIVQFSTAPVGQATFTGDPAQSARDYLHRVYYQQRDYRNRMFLFANQFERLNIAPPTAKELSNPVLECTRHGFEARVDLKRPGGEQQTWSINHDAQFKRRD